MCTYRLDIEFPSLIKNKLGVLEGSGGDFGRGEGKKTRGLRDGGRTVNTPTIHQPRQRGTSQRKTPSIPMALLQQRH